MKNPLSLPPGSVRSILALALIFTTCGLTAFVVIANKSEPTALAALTGLSGMAGMVLEKYFHTRAAAGKGSTDA